MFAFAAIVVGSVLHLIGEDAAGQAAWGAAVAGLAAELAAEVARTVVVEHSLGVDTIALVAMVGALALGEELAGAVIGLMFSGGAALEVVRSVSAEPDRRPVIMVGDGINDAPALAIADIGIAMGALHIARQSVLAGMGLSIAAMGVAALGCLPRSPARSSRRQSTRRDPQRSARAARMTPGEYPETSGAMRPDFAG